MAKHHDNEFRTNAVRYRFEHMDLPVTKCAENLGISDSTLSRWIANYEDNNGKIEMVGSGNYASEEAKEIARLRRELRDTKDALDILKKALGILGKE